MRDADLAPALELWRNTNGVGVRSEDNIPTLSQFLARNPSSCFVLSDDQTVVGTVLGAFDGRRGYINHLAVHPHYRKHGYGQALLDHAVQALRGEGVHKVFLFVFEDNQEAITFYQHRGWNERGELKVFDLELAPV